MKYLKMLGLAAVAAMALTAFIGAGSASATVLCTVTPAKGAHCGTANHVDHLNATIVAGTSATLRSTGGISESTCTGSEVTVKKEVTGSTTTTAAGTVASSDLKWTVCAQTTHTLEGGTLEVHHIAGTDNGTVTAKGFKVTTVTPVGSCIYGAGAGITLGTLTGGANATLDINAVVERQAGSAFFCPADSVWEGQYRITNHKSVFVAAG